MIIRKIISDFVLSHSNNFSREDIQTSETEQVYDYDLEHREYVLDAIKNLKSRMKTLTITLVARIILPDNQYYLANQRQANLVLDL
jgi:hypothetical protein